MQSHKGLVSPEDINVRASELETFFDEHEVPTADQYMFAYYSLQAPAASVPEWTWNAFDRGIVPFNGYAAAKGSDQYDIGKLDGLADLLVPNYRKPAEGLPAVLDSAKYLAGEMADKLEHGSILLVANHPTIATPIILGRAAVEALRPGIPDIQERMYIALGMKPTVFKYDFGEFGSASPVGMVSAVGNVAITAAVSDSNTQPELKKPQERFRNLFKGNIADALSRPGNIVVVILNGQTDVPYTKFDANARKIHLPEGGLELFDRPNVWMVNASVYDTLLEGRDISSPVQIYFHPRIREVSRSVLTDANIVQAMLIDPTFDGTRYFAEREDELDIRLSDRREMVGDYLKRAPGKIINKLRG